MGAIKSKSTERRPASTRSAASNRRSTSPSVTSGGSVGGDQQQQLLNPYQRSLLRNAWSHISKGGQSNIGNTIFKRMLNKDPNIKKVFQHAFVIDGVFGLGMTPIQSCQQHSVMFVDLLDEAITNLSNADAIAEKCRDFGAKHAKLAAYGMTQDYWDTFGEAMTESAREWEGWRRHRETLKAWTILVSFIVDRFRQGFDDGVRRRNTTNALGANARYLPPGRSPTPPTVRHSIASPQASDGALRLLSRLPSGKGSPDRRRTLPAAIYRGDSAKRINAPISE